MKFLIVEQKILLDITEDILSIKTRFPVGNENTFSSISTYHLEISYSFHIPNSDLNSFKFIFSYFFKFLTSLS